MRQNRIVLLSDDLMFPNPELADPHGLLAVGGDLSVERLLLAYENAIFPWYSEEQPILWFFSRSSSGSLSKEVQSFKKLEKINK